jgi:hypothetical protein
MLREYYHLVHETVRVTRTSCSRDYHTRFPARADGRSHNREGTFKDAELITQLFASFGYEMMRRPNRDPYTDLTAEVRKVLILKR